jgi:predicted metal-dependent phosphotriesterase family hydrolase
MSFARTVLGDVDVSTLGRTNAHEHLAISSGLITVQHPDYRLDDPERGVIEAQDFHDAGGQTIVDTTPCGAGRDAKALVAISRATGVHVIASTGFHKEGYYLDSHWRFHYSAEEIAGLWRDEIEHGVELSAYEGPHIKRSTAQAGVVKVAADYQHISKHARKAFEAAGQVHRVTGVPVLTHSEAGTVMLEQVRLLESHGIAPQHVVISHADRNPDWFVHRDVAQSGAYLEYDCPGRVKYFPESTIVALIRKMFDLGLEKHLLFGGDNARRSYWKAYGGGPGIAYILRSFVPRLLREGFTQAQIDQVLIANPSSAFQFSCKSAGGCD